MNGIAVSTLLLLSLTTSACQAGGPVASTCMAPAHASGRVAPTGTLPTRREAGDALAPERIAGEWAFHEVCGDRHAVTMTLVSKGRSVTGAWDDGTLVSGSSGLLRGRIVGHRIDMDLCTSTDDGSVPACTPTGFHGDYFVLRGGRLLWMKDVDGRQTIYVTLDRPSAKSAPSAQGCDDEE